MLFSLALGVALAALVALETVGVGPAEAAFPGANGKIAFSSDRVTATNPTGDDEKTMRRATMMPVDRQEVMTRI